MSTAEKLDEKTRHIAAEEEIPLYKAQMLQYIAANAREGQAKKEKEALKAKLTPRLRSLGKYAELVEIPGSDDQVAVARIYEQREPKVDMELAARLLSPVDFDRVFYTKMGERFTVTAMAQKTGAECVANTNEYWEKKAAEQAALHDKMKADLDALKAKLEGK